jgi:hypothetical protein
MRALALLSAIRQTTGIASLKLSLAGGAGTSRGAVSTAREN